MPQPVKERIADLAAKIAAMPETDAETYVKRISDWHADIANEKGYGLIDAIADVLDETDPYSQHIRGDL